MNSCQCGCGQTTKSRFAPGHDAKLKGQLLRAARMGDELAIRELERLGWLHFFDKADTRKFGVEIECFVPDRYTVADRLTEAGIVARCEYYNHETRDHWKITTDGSLGHIAGWDAIEIVSPILSGKRGMEQLEKVCAVLAEVGAKVDTSCGLHVHHDANDLTLAAALALTTNYVLAEPSIDAIMAPSRRGDNNHFCRTLSHHDLIHIRDSYTLAEMVTRTPSRYQKLNWKSYPKYGTVEFRQHQGTVEFVKISNWIKFGQALITASKALKTVTHRNDAISGEVLSFYNQRESHFAALAA